MPESLRKSLDAFLNQEAKIMVTAWSVIQKGKKTEYTPMNFLTLRVSKGKLRIQADRGYGVWDGDEGIVVHRSKGKLSFVPCSKKRQLLEAFGLDQVLMGPVGGAEWSGPIRLQGDEGYEVDGRLIMPPPFDYYGFRRVVDGRRVGMNWRINVDGSLDQVGRLSRIKGNDADKYFSFGEVRKLDADERTFFVERSE